MLTFKKKKKALYLLFVSIVDGLGELHDLLRFGLSGISRNNSNWERTYCMIEIEERECVCECVCM